MYSFVRTLLFLGISRMILVMHAYIRLPPSPLLWIPVFGHSPEKTTLRHFGIVPTVLDLIF